MSYGREKGLLLFENGRLLLGTMLASVLTGGNSIVILK